MTSSYSNKQAVKCLLCIIDVYSKYTWVKPLNNKKSKKGLDGFMVTVNEFDRKSNNLWVDKGK